jgi:hypothetical protein
MRLLAGLHQSPQRVSALLHAPRRRWATCAGRSPGSRLRRSCQPSRKIQCGLFSGICGNSSPLTVAGAAPELRVAALTVFPFSPCCVATARNLHNLKGPEAAGRVKRSARACGAKAPRHRRSSDGLGRRQHGFAELHDRAIRGLQTAHGLTDAQAILVLEKREQIVARERLVLVRDRR